MAASRVRMDRWNDGSFASPLGAMPSILSAATIAREYDQTVRLIVDMTTRPPGLQSSAKVRQKEGGSTTCSTTSELTTTSNRLFSDARASPVVAT